MLVPKPILYSTNTFLKLLINEKYLGDIHYVWCSDCFDSSKTGAYGVAAIAAPSSDPSRIYKQLQADVQKSDRHSAKINEQKLSFAKLAADWKADGRLSASDAEEIVYMADNADFQLWRPLLYVIPREKVITRLQDVPIARCASLGREFIIPDLKRDEFDIVEV